MLQPEEDRFHTNIQGLSDCIIAIVTEANERNYNKIPAELLGVAGAFLKDMDKNILITSFINRSEKYWSQIHVKDRNFFLQHADIIFEGLPLEHVNNFRMLFADKYPNGSFIISNDDTEILWQYFHSLVKISVQYISKRPSKFQKIDYHKYAKSWNILLLT